MDEWMIVEEWQSTNEEVTMIGRTFISPSTGLLIVIILNGSIPARVVVWLHEEAARDCCVRG